jgi:hypothetical protein
MYFRKKWENKLLMILKQIPSNLKGIHDSRGLSLYPTPPEKIP